VFHRIISSAQLSQHLVKLLDEVLRRHGEEAAAREVVRRALSEVCATFDAEDPIQLELFANGELADAVSDVVGPDYVDEVVAHVLRTAHEGSGSPSHRWGGLARRDADTIPDKEPESQGDEASQPLALVITEDDATYEVAMQALERAGILCFECGSDPLEVVSESRALDATYVIYDAEVSPEHPANLCAQMRRALGDETPKAVVLVDDGQAHFGVERPGWLATLRKGRLDGELAQTLRALEAQPREAKRDVPVGAQRRRRMRGRRTGSGAAAMARRGRRTFDHVLGEALGSVANDRILELVLENALSSAGMKSIPTSAVGFERFVGGALRDSVGDLLGDDAYLAVQRALEPVISQAVSINYRRRRTGVDREPEVRRPLDRLLIVHRDERTAKRLASILARHGEEVMTTTDGYVALGMLMQHPPDLVVADSALPAVSADDFIAQAHEMHGAKAPPIILIGRGAPGAAQVVSAPVKPRELIAAVGEVQRRA